MVQAFDVGRGSMLRLFKGHTAAVNVVRFARGAGALELISGADDCTVRNWDLSTGSEVSILQGPYWRCRIW